MNRKIAILISALLVIICTLIFISVNKINHKNTAPETTAAEGTDSVDVRDTADTEADTDDEVTTSPETAPPETTAPETTEAAFVTTAPPEPVPEPVWGKGMYTGEQLAALDNTKSGYGQGLSVDEYNRPYGAINAQNAYGQYGALFIAPSNGIIYLTFDLGYENGYTGKILDILKEKGVHATFFATMDYCRTSPDIVARIVNEGHTLGNHSVSHKSMPTLSVNEMENEIMGLHNYIKSAYGYEMRFFRPPMGEFSPRSLACVQNLGYTSVNWSFAYYDYDNANQPEPVAAYERVTGAAHSGAIYLLHAVSATNTQILPDVIDKLIADGYRLEALT